MMLRPGGFGDCFSQKSGQEAYTIFTGTRWGVRSNNVGSSCEEVYKTEQFIIACTSFNLVGQRAMNGTR